MWIFSLRSAFSGKSRARGRRGFTLIELMAVISIMLIITAAILLRQQRFDSSTLLRTLAYSIALSVRQAQVYGVSIRESASGSFNQLTAGTETTAAAYGIYFSSTAATSYILFADLNGNGQYNAGEEVQTFSISKGYSIAKFCVTPTGGTANQYCSNAGNISSLTILFTRPDPDACIATSRAANACQKGVVPAETYTGSYVQLVGPTGGSDTRSVSISITGEVSVGAQGS